MYKSIVTTDGATAVGAYIGSSELVPGPDGLIFSPPNGTPKELVIPERLHDWLIDLRLLRHMPLVYLVPDSELLPTESIRFFNVDTTWVDRVIDGVFSAANTGTTDAVFCYTMLSSVRSAIDSSLISMANQLAPDSPWSPEDGMTGMLIRSELARRWPNMVVEAWTKTVDNWSQPHTSKQIAILRGESISPDIYIALFAGSPKMVTIREPFSGVRFGVEQMVPDTQTNYKVDSRQENGLPVSNVAVPLPIQWRGPATLRVIDFADLGGKGIASGSPRQLAINLEQKPYMQEFKDDAAHFESLGSQALTGTKMHFRKGRYMTLTSLKNRLSDQEAAG